ncbi:MAG: T9SS type A sorting domain-containing protein [Schleiferiaceae bacterium]|nr:T9SS type A sorting domain-containing protein [Schleiferiaceae bacterium]
MGNIHPNPTSGMAQLPISFQQEADVRITVRNIQGQLMTTMSVHGSEGMNTFQIETTGWASGLYLVEAITPSGTDVQRLIVE